MCSKGRRIQRIFEPEASSTINLAHDPVLCDAVHSGRTLRRSLTQVCAGHSGTELFRFPVTIRHSVERCRLIAFEQRVTARSAPATTVRASAPTCSQEPPGRLPAQGNSSACMPMSSAHSWEPTRPKLQLVIVPAAFCVL
jgi:hypothetical protein